MSEKSEDPAVESSASVRRVIAAAERLGLAVAVRRMPASTRTAQEAADACGCALDQIVKSLMFQGAETGRLGLFLVSGGGRLDPIAAQAAFGEPLEKADAKRVRAETGFAIGGVAPIGHLAASPVFLDARLLDFEIVWAAAGAPNAVFSAAPQALADATGATVVALRAPGSVA